MMFGMKYTTKFFLYCVFFCLAFADFSYKIGPCRFEYKQQDDCKSDENPDKKSEPEIKGFYWRPYSNGIIPSDAYPISKPMQQPRTFMGFVYDPSRPGSVIVTIVEGVKTVKTIVSGIIKELDTGIKILCTMEPQKFAPFNASDPNKPTDYVAIWETTHIKDSKQINPFATVLQSCGIAYASSAISSDSEYVTLDGKPKKTNHYVYLVFLANQTAQPDESNKKGQGFISHQYEYSIRPNSIIPSYYKMLRIGSFSMLCTNKGGKDIHLGSKATSTTPYFWVIEEFFSDKLALPVGSTNTGQVSYVGQVADVGYKGENVGTTLDGRKVIIFVGDRQVNINIFRAMTFSTTTPEVFDWMPSTSSEFITMDTSKFILGGMLPNGTQIYIGRTMAKGYPCPAGILKFESSALAFYADNNYHSGTSSEFEVLYYKGT